MGPVGPAWAGLCSQKRGPVKVNVYDELICNVAHTGQPNVGYTLVLVYHMYHAMTLLGPRELEGSGRPPNTPDRSADPFLAVI